jgi:uncharacterized protein (DUF488 family)
MAPVLWTVGHSNHPFETFLRMIRQPGIEYVVDVRSYPYSRIAPQYNREDLAVALDENGVKYLFLGEALGGRPSDEAHFDPEGHALYEPMSREQPFQEAIRRLLQGAESHKIALLCSEKDPSHCHRRLLVGKVLAERGAELRHILADGEPWTERAVVLEAQESLFGDRSSAWRSTQSVSHRRRLSTSSAG